MKSWNFNLNWIHNDVKIPLLLGFFLLNKGDQQVDRYLHKINYKTRKEKKVNYAI